MRAVHQHGLVGASVQYWNRLREKLFEKGLGIRSGDVISLREFGLEHEERRERQESAFFSIMEKADQFMLNKQLDLGAHRRCCVFR